MFRVVSDEVLNYMQEQCNAISGLEWDKDFIREASKLLSQREILDYAPYLHILQDMDDPMLLTRFVFSLRLA